MEQNTYKHISDEARYTWFDPTGTLFPVSVKNVQDALALTAPTKQATETQIGVLKIATQTEVNSGVDDTTAVTPKKLAERLRFPQATETQIGVLALATNAEAQTGSNKTKAIVPSSLKHVLDWTFTTRLSTESKIGVLKLSTEVAAIAGVDNTTAMTPLRVKQAIANATSQIPSYTPASESNAGLVTLATVGQTSQGVLREGYAISPYTLMQLTGNNTRKGVVQAATLTQANAGTDESLYISAKGFKTYVATNTNVGTVKISKDVIPNSTGTALSASANVVSSNSQTIQVANTKLNVTGQLQYKGSEVITEQSIYDHMPVGAIIMWGGETLPSNKYEICDGGLESVANSPVLFAKYGFKYGGNNVDMFARPDMRGLFVRGVGVGEDILSERGFDKFNKPLLGNDVTGGKVGEVQKQMLIKHKHATAIGEHQYRPWGGTAYSNKLGVYRPDYDNTNPFTNDGSEIEPESIRNENTTLNTIELIGHENRPWNISMYYIIKVR